MIITADGDEEQHYLDIVKDVYPLLSLRTLAANIEHAICEVAQLEYGFCDAGSPQPGAENVLVCRQVVLCKETFDVGKEAATIG
jgi:hypothetical protein